MRALARPLLSIIFVVQGANSIRNPEPLVPKAQPVTDRLVPMVKRVAPPQVGDRIPETTVNLVRLNGAVQVVGGLALASGKGRRLARATLAAIAGADHDGRVTRSGRRRTRRSGPPSGSSS